MATRSQPSPPMTAGAGGPDVFHLFSQLPSELRIKIWNLSLPNTRLLPIRCGSDSISLEPSSSLSWTSGATSSARIPAILHVCHEARNEALKQYSLHFGFARGPGQVFFNPLRDVLYFGPCAGYMAADAQFSTFVSLCAPAELEAVERIAVNDALFWIDSSVYRSMSACSLTVELLRRIQARMPNLREIVFVPRDPAEVTSGDPAYCDPAMVYVRMARQIQTAMATLCEQTGTWNPPTWRILPLSAFPDPYA